MFVVFEKERGIGLFFEEWVKELVLKNIRWLLFDLFGVSEMMRVFLYLIER